MRIAFIDFDDPRDMSQMCNLLHTIWQSMEEPLVEIVHNPHEVNIDPDFLRRPEASETNS